jgi:hypothetical protein
MRLTHKLIIAILFLVLTGCGIIEHKHDYTWKEYPITSERISPQVNFTEGREVNIIKGKTNDSKVLMGDLTILAHTHKYYGSLQLLTDGIADQLTKEMRNKRLEIKSTAEKSLEITVNRSTFELGTWAGTATMEFTVKFGNGNTKSYTVKNTSPNSIDQIYNGAVALAVIEIINDLEVLTYING